MGNMAFKPTKKKIAVIISVVLFLLFVYPVVFLAVGLFTPARFSDTYFGQFAPMTDKLYSTDGKKVVVIGTSSVAFGVDSALFEELLNENGYDYSVCNYGLYGALGTKIMMDYAKPAIKEGDIVILSPEPLLQTMSLFFSAENAWRALDGRADLLPRLGKDNYAEMVGNFPKYVAEKYKYMTSDAMATGSGVYARASFDENGDLKNFQRKNNVMLGGYDATVPFDFSSLTVSPMWEYMNDYAKELTARGATVCFSFAPMNERAVDRAQAEEYFENVYSALTMPVLGDPHDSCMEAEWFYDSNVHLNAAGMTVRTVRLFNDVKTFFGDGSATDYPLPAKPEFAIPDDVDDGDNSFASCFNYELSADGTYYTIISMTAEGEGLTSVVVPVSYNSLPVRAFSVGTFAGNKALEEIVLQKNIRRVEDFSFDGCTHLKRVRVLHEDPLTIVVNFDLLSGAPSAKIVIDRARFESFTGAYVWRYHIDEGHIVLEG